MTAPAFSDYLNRTETARLLRCHPMTVYRLQREGRLPAVWFGNQWLFHHDTVWEFKATYHPHVAAHRAGRGCSDGRLY